jgi:hypothetical protein
MTEAEWLAFADPAPMLMFLRGRASKRKLRLFAVACCRRHPHLILDGDSRSAIEVAERLADGRATNAERRAAAAAVQASGLVRGGRTFSAASGAVRGSPFGAAQARSGYTRWLVVGGLGEPLPGSHTPAATQAIGREAHQQAVLLRDIFNNPFRPAAFDPHWRTADVLGLAHGIYEDRAFNRLPLLADALMDAGCADDQVIGHCRLEGPHARGCWVVDLALGKE